jgi:hypothetical protein
MCTLSYLPRNNGYYLVNNRDESPSRAITLQPQTLDINGKTVLCPIDTEGKGTWIGVNDSGRMVCLMNGAFELHVKKTYYRMSRGRVTLELLGADDAVAYFQGMDLNDIEPFTVIIIDEVNVVVLRWDEVRKHEEILSKDVPHIWSSATLYEPKVARARMEYFNSHITQFDSHNEVLNQWHMDKIEGAPSVLLNLPMVITVSITSITKTDVDLKMKYEDLLHDHMYKYELPIQSEVKS